MAMSLPAILLSFIFFWDICSTCKNIDIVTITKIIKKRGRSGTGFKVYATSGERKYNVGVDTNSLPYFKVGDRITIEVSCIFRNIKSIEVLNSNGTTEFVKGKDTGFLFLLGAFYSFGMVTFIYREKVTNNLVFMVASSLLGITASIQLLILSFRLF